MGTVCTSLNDKKYSKLKKNETEKMSSETDGGKDHNTNMKDHNTNMKISKDFQVYQFIKKENRNDLIQFLITNEIDINDYIFNNEMTILHRAIKLESSANYVEFLILKGSKIENVEIDTMNTPLYIAVNQLSEDIVFVILKYSPNIFHKNNENKELKDILDEISKSKLSKEQSIKFEKIVRMINDFKIKLEKTEKLD
jgi:ankyrin repeat protein